MNPTGTLHPALRELVKLLAEAAVRKAIAQAENENAPAVRPGRVVVASQKHQGNGCDGRSTDA